MLKNLFLIILLFSAIVLFAQDLSLFEQTAKAVVRSEYPDYPAAHSSWGSICYSKKYDKVVIAVTNHHDSVAIYNYDVKTKSMKLVGFMQDLANLREHQWQGKVHSQMLEGNDGWIYFGGDGGEEREEHYMNHVNGYVGGIFAKFNPNTNEFIRLKFALRNESLKTLEIDLVRNRVYTVSYPSCHFLVYDIKTANWRDFGVVNGMHVPRVILSDKWGNGYYTDARGRLMMFNADADSFIVADKRLPALDSVPAFLIRSGLTAYASTKNKDTLYLNTEWGTLVRFIPKQYEIGEITDLGSLYGAKNEFNRNIYAPNLAYSKEKNCLFYFLGGHGHFVTKDSKTVFMQYNLSTNTKREINRISAEIQGEATGSNIVDADGNIYYASRKTIIDTTISVEDAGESGLSKAIFTIFNPKKIK